MATLTFSNAPITAVVGRKTSIIEYAHAAVGTSPKTIDTARECIMTLAGRLDATVQLDEWRRAIAEATRVNPGARLELTRSRGSLRWNSTGEMPRLRVVDDAGWDGSGPAGSEFLTAMPIDLHGGSSVEVILAGGDRQFVAFRTFHAVMDGMGLVHYIQDVFRCLRGEEPVGTNSDISDWDMLRGLDLRGAALPKGKPPYALGQPEGDAIGDTWRSFRVGAAPAKLLPLILRTLAQSAARYSDQPARMAVPITLRRYYPGLHTTMNTTSMIHLEVSPRDDLDDIADALRTKVDGKIMAKPPALLPLFKALPPTVLDATLGRTAKNHTTRKILETAVVSNMGQFRGAEFTGGGFTPVAFYGMPIPGNTFVSFCSLDDELWVTVGVEETYATGGRLDDLVDILAAALGG